MSVLVTAKIGGDVATFTAALESRAEEFAVIAARAQTEGAIHHRFGVGDGFVVIVDEWESAAHFEKFFSNPELQAFVGAVGGDTSAPPEITVSEAVDSADRF